VNAETRKLLDVTKASLYKGIEAAVAGARTGDIGHAVQSYVESFGFSVVRELEGHGLGKEMHEAPGVPNFGKRGHGARLAEGVVICIEPMVNAGGRGVYLARNGWAVHTADHRKSAHFELTVVVRHGKAEQLSTFDYIESTDNS
jgi:methionyl aminopeptidase